MLALKNRFEVHDQAFLTIHTELSLAGMREVDVAKSRHRLYNLGRDL